ncbi:MAG: hypothetical protein IJX28_07250 [Clostridia bacterium]|nr:hypothetical protein [Clostridia bacterium]
MKKILHRNRGGGSQIADKGVSAIKITKSFGQAFLKACAVEGAEPSSTPAGGEILFSAFLFDNFFFAPLASKKKWLTNLYYLTNCFFHNGVCQQSKPPVQPVVCTAPVRGYYRLNP